MTRVTAPRTAGTTRPGGSAFDTLGLHRVEHERMLAELHLAATRRRPGRRSGRRR